MSFVSTKTKWFSTESEKVTHKVMRVAVFAGLTALAAQLSVRVPMTPVPMTLQTAVVLASGLFIGSIEAVLAQLLYLTLGAIGMPWFANGSSGLALLTGTTSGYFVGFLAASYIQGYARKYCSTLALTSLATFGSSLVIFLFGTLGLMLTLDVSLNRALELGVYPFLFGDILKVFLASTAYTLFRK